MKLAINKPCQENWDNMLSEEQGRFCKVCAKTVIDFSQASTKEIFDTLAKNSGETCGRVRSQQLMMPYISAATARGYRIPYAPIAASLLFVAASFTVITATAQNQIAPPTELVQGAMVAVNPISTPKLRQADSSINGKVLDQETKQPISGVSISIITPTAKYTAFTIDDGTFSIQVPKDIIKDKNVLTTDFSKATSNSAEGKYYRHTNEVYTKAQLSADMTVEAYEDYMLAGGIRAYRPEVDPVVIVKGKEVDYEEYRKALEGKKSSCTINPNEAYQYFDGAAAEVLAGKPCPEGLYLYQ